MKAQFALSGIASSCDFVFQSPQR